MLNRRNFLRAGSGALTLPFLQPFRPAYAGEGDSAPKRIILFHYPQGTVMRDFVPFGTERDFTLGPILQPLEPYKDCLLIVNGVDNVMPNYNSVGNAHNNTNLTILTGRPFFDQNPAQQTAAGPSIEQEIALRIGGSTPYRRLDYAIGGRETSNGSFTPGAYFFVGPNDPIGMYNDPVQTALRIFGDGTISPEEAAAQRSRRGAALSSVLSNFQLIRNQLSAEDRLRLEAHEEKLLELEARIASGVGECSAPSVELPAGYGYGNDDDVSAPVMLDILVTAMACDYTRVSTITFANDHAPTFPWLWSRNGGSPIVEPSVWDNWHAMVHADYQPGMEIVYRWYMEVFASLLDRLATTTDADGDNMLETSLVVCFSEFSSGRHWTRNIPFILAGNAGSAPLGRWLNLMPGTVDDYENRNGYLDSGYTTNQLFVSLLQAFGYTDETFGHHDSDLPSGPLPGFFV